MNTESQQRQSASEREALLERHTAFMKLALGEAQLAYGEGEAPVGAVLVADGKVFARQHNRMRALHDPTAHAELLCLQEAAKKRVPFQSATLYVTLEPCAMCSGAIVNAHLGSLVFGAFDTQLGCCGSVYDLAEGLGYRVALCGGVLAEPCAQLLTRFFQARRESAAE